jgi:hypothetical protein
MDNLAESIQHPRRIIPYSRNQQGGQVKYLQPLHKAALLAVVMIAWTALWLMPLEDTEKIISSVEWGMFGVSHGIAFFFLVKWLSDHLQEKDNNRIRRILDEHDSRNR